MGETRTVNHVGLFSSLKEVNDGRSPRRLERMLSDNLVIVCSSMEPSLPGSPNVLSTAQALIPSLVPH